MMSAATSLGLTSRRKNKERFMTNQGSGASGVTADDLAKASRTRVFFGHPSARTNILRAYAAESWRRNREGAQPAATLRFQAIAPSSPR